MFSHAITGARAAGLALLAAALLAGCGGSNDPAQVQTAPAATPAAARLVVDTGSAAPVVGNTLTLKATLLAADGSEVKGASFAWTSSDPSVAAVLSVSDKAPAATGTAPVGIYALIQALTAGTVDIAATATLADGSRVASLTHLVVQAVPAKSYTLALTPATLAVTAGGAAQTVTVSVRRSDGVDGIADLTGWSWTSDDATFVATPAADGHSAQVASPASAYATGAATLTACADAPAGTRLCANAALARNASLPPTYTVGGTVSGLASGKSLQLADTNGDTQVITANGGFTMPTSRLGATAYAVTVVAQPAGQTCTVSNGAGTVAAANVANLAISCGQAQFVVVANRDDSTLSVYRVNQSTGALASVAGSPFAAGGQVNDIVFTASGLTAYAVVNRNSVVGFSLDPATGALARIPGNTVSTLSQYGANAITIAPAGDWLYVTGQASIASYPIVAGNVHSWNYLLGSTGSDMPRPAVSANGQYVYTANLQADTLQSLRSDPSGYGFAFTSTLAGVSTPRAAVLSPTGSFLYAPLFASNIVVAAAVDPSSGALMPPGAFVTPALGPTDIALSSSGPFAYVLGSTSNTIAIHTLGASGAADGPVSVIPASLNGQQLRLAPGGRFLYAPSLNGTLYAFAVDGASGALTAVPGSPFAAGNGNVAIAVVEPQP